MSFKHIEKYFELAEILNCLFEEQFKNRFEKIRAKRKHEEHVEEFIKLKLHQENLLREKFKKSS